MIKNFTPQTYDGVNSLPTYVSNLNTYTLTATVQGGYEITLGRLTTGNSVSAGNPLSHALFESFTDHGVRGKAARTRVSGYDSDFIAVKNAMIETGVEFLPTVSVPADVVMESLGEWFKAQNSDILSWSLVSQD